MKKYRHCKFLLVFLLSFLAMNLKAQEETFVMSQLGPNNMLNRPWDLEYGPDEWLWVTERERGAVVRVNPETGVKDQLLIINSVFSSSRQDGLLGMALHRDLLGDSPFVYLSYTYSDDGQRVQKLVRYTLEVNESNNGSLVDGIDILDGLPSSNDHNSGRLIFGPDDKLYYTIGDQGGNQNSNYCNPILSQVLPTQEEIDSMDWSNYPGKTLRINLDGSIPMDNPILNGVQSHIFTYGHRNAQGIVFSQDGKLYSDEHGPDTDDEVNQLVSGMNYGWPRVVGFKDDQAYDYCDWSSLENCNGIDYTKTQCPEGASFLEESTFTEENYMEPIFSMFAVTDDYDFNNPICGSAWMCRPNVAPSSLAIYESDAIPSWKNSLLVTSLKRGRVYRLKLDEEGNAIEGDTSQHFYTINRYRDIVIHPDGKTIFMITDQEGNTSDASGLNIERDLRNPGTILKFSVQEATSVVEKQLTGVSIWPNPASNQISIDIEEEHGKKVDAVIMNLSGQRVDFLEDLKPSINSISITGLSPGIYFIKVFSNGKIWSEKLTIL